MSGYMASNENNDHLIDLCILRLLEIVEDDTITHEMKNLADSDWYMLICRSSAHKVAPLLYQRLLDNGVDEFVPEHAIQMLRRLYLNNSFINSQKFVKLSNILKAFDKEKIQVIVLKGFAVGGLVYDNIALRPMGDIDLLVKSEDVSKIDSILSNLGWTNESPQLFAKSKKRVTGDITFSKDSVFIDMQTKLHLMPKLDIWKKVSFIEINGINVPILELNDFLLHLCLHLNQHICVGFSELIRLCDIMEMLEKFGDQLDWKYIADTAKANKAEDGLYRILNIIAKTSAKHLVPDIDISKKDGLSLSVYDMLLIPKQKGNSGIKIGLTTSLNSEILPLRYKIRRILGLVFPSKSYMIQRYTPKHPYLFFFYYPLRFVLGIIILIRH